MFLAPPGAALDPVACTAPYCNLSNNMARDIEAWDKAQSAWDKQQIDALRSNVAELNKQNAALASDIRGQEDTLSAMGYPPVLKMPKAVAAPTVAPPAKTLPGQYAQLKILRMEDFELRQRHADLLDVSTDYATLIGLLEKEGIRPAPPTPPNILMV